MIRNRTISANNFSKSTYPFATIPLHSNYSTLAPKRTQSELTPLRRVFLWFAWNPWRMGGWILYLFETTTARIRSGWFVLCLFFFWGGGAVVNRFVMYFLKFVACFVPGKEEQARGYPPLLDSQSFLSQSQHPTTAPCKHAGPAATRCVTKLWKN